MGDALSVPFIVSWYILTTVITVGTLRCESGDTSKNVTGKLRVRLVKVSNYYNSFSVLIR